jgi:hypothetical protein
MYKCGEGSDVAFWRRRSCCGARVSSRCYPDAFSARCLFRRRDDHHRSRNGRWHAVRCCLYSLRWRNHLSTRGRAAGPHCWEMSGVETEQPIDKAHLGSAADCFDPEAELALSEHPHQLKAGDRSPCQPHGFKAEGRPDQPLRLSLILPFGWCDAEPFCAILAIWLHT